MTKNKKDLEDREYLKQILISQSRLSTPLPLIQFISFALFIFSLGVTINGIFHKDLYQLFGGFVLIITALIIGNDN